MGHGEPTSFRHHLRSVYCICHGFIILRSNNKTQVDVRYILMTETHFSPTIPWHRYHQPLVGEAHMGSLQLCSYKEEPQFDLEK